MLWFILLDKLVPLLVKINKQLWIPRIVKWVTNFINAFAIVFYRKISLSIESTIKARYHFILYYSFFIFFLDISVDFYIFQLESLLFYVVTSKWWWYRVESMGVKLLEVCIYPNLCTWRKFILNLKCWEKIWWSKAILLWADFFY